LGVRRTWGARALFEEIDERSEELVKEGKPQKVANMAWAFAKAGARGDTLFWEDRRKERLAREGGKHPDGCERGVGVREVRGTRGTSLTWRGRG
jgi:hypothetical protein